MWLTRKKAFSPVGYQGLGNLPQDGFGWQCCAVNNPVRLWLAPVRSVKKSCWSYLLTWEALFLICRPSLLANENRDCFLWAVSLQEMRPEAGEACFFGSHAKAYLEKHGVYSLTRLHSKFWAWVAWGNWWCHELMTQIGTTVKNHDCMTLVTFPSLLIWVSSVKRRIWTMASESVF